MKWSVTAVLALLALAGALFFFLVEQPRHARETGRIAAQERLTATSAEEVQSILIVRPDIAVTAVRRGDHWELTSPVADRADDGAFNMLVLSVCQALVERRFDVEESELPEYGLAPPSVTVRLEAAGGASLVELRVGELNPSRSHCYAIAGDDGEVVLLPSGIRRYALRPLFEYRNKRIFDVEPADVARIEIASPRGSMTWTSAENGRWFTVVGADTIRGNETAVGNIVRQLRGLRARDILVDPWTADATSGDLAGTIHLWTLSDTAEIALSFTHPRGDGCYVVASRTGRTALVDTAMIPTFDRSLDDFRDKRIVSFDEDALARVTWETPELVRTIARGEGGWQYANPAFGEIREDTSHRLVSTLASIEFGAVIETRFAKATGHGFDSPALRITLFDSDDRVIDEAVFGSLLPDGASRYVWSRSTRALSTLGPESASRLDDVLSAFGGP